MKRKRIENFVIFMNEELGKGSFGQVYKGVNQKTKQPVAIKVLSKKMIDQDDYVKDALVQEIKIMKNLNSQAIVKFVDILQTPNNYYVIQELCDGGDLKSLIKKEKRFSQNKCIDYMAQICNGYEQLIDNSVIHRDLKPENLLIHGGRVKLADFGFAKYVMSDTALQKSVVGTPKYMSPEILKRVKYTSKCDVWSIGAIFYEMLFGCMPWVATSEYELVCNIQNVPLTFPSTIEVSEKSKSFIKGCLQPDEANRMSWLEIYSHPIFKDRFKSFAEKNKKLAEKAGYLINGLRVEIHAQNIDLEKLFNKRKLTKHSTLDKTQFFSLMKTIDPNLDHEDLKYVFSEFDTNCSGTIDFQEFKMQLEQSGIRMKSLGVSSVKKKRTRNFTEGQEEQSQRPQSISPEKNKEALANEVIVKLREKIDEHDLDILTVYNSCDMDSDDMLSFQEFSKLLLKIDNRLQEQELKLCFGKFDHNGDKTISFEEFLRTISKIAGDPFHRRRISE